MALPEAKLMLSASADHTPGIHCSTGTGFGEQDGLQGVEFRFVESLAGVGRGRHDELPEDRGGRLSAESRSMASRYSVWPESRYLRSKGVRGEAASNSSQGTARPVACSRAKASSST